MRVLRVSGTAMEQLDYVNRDGGAREEGSKRRSAGVRSMSNHNGAVSSYEQGWKSKGVREYEEHE